MSGLLVNCFPLLDRNMVARARAKNVGKGKSRELLLLTHMDEKSRNNISDGNAPVDVRVPRNAISAHK